MYVARADNNQTVTISKVGCDTPNGLFKLEIWDRSDPEVPLIVLTFSRIEMRDLGLAIDNALKS